MYQPTLGRFLSRDPLSQNGVEVLTDTGIYADRLAAMTANPRFYGGNWEHRYVYARNNPVWYTDPSGLQPGVAIPWPVIVELLELIAEGGAAAQAALAALRAVLQASIPGLGWLLLSRSNNRCVGVRGCGMQAMHSWAWRIAWCEMVSELTIPRIGHAQAALEGKGLRLSGLISTGAQRDINN